MPGCKGEASNFISDISGDEYVKTVCGHSHKAHTYVGDGSCYEIIGDGCDVGDEHGARYCDCKGWKP